MTLNQSALLELPEAMRTADEGKLMRTLFHTTLQALVDAEAPSTSVLAGTSRTTRGPRNATAPAPRWSPRLPAT